MHDKYKKKFQGVKASDRVRRQIAVEAARRMIDAVGPDPDDPGGHLKEASTESYYTAKRKAAAVLGHRVRPGDLPSDTEVRAELIVLARSRTGQLEEEEQPEPSPDESLRVMSDHLDRFAIYRLRLLPLEGVKQNPKTHPEGDALFHSLQVFERAREVRPYDEEFLLAALLHDVGKGIGTSNHVGTGVEALRGAVTERTLWLIEHHMDLHPSREKELPLKARREMETSEYYEDLKLLREVDDAGRVPGIPVCSVEEALAYLQGLEEESYLESSEESA